MATGITFQYALGSSPRSQHLTPAWKRFVESWQHKLQVGLGSIQVPDLIVAYLQLCSSHISRCCLRTTTYVVKVLISKQQEF